MILFWEICPWHTMKTWFCATHITKEILVSITPQKCTLVCNTPHQINKSFSAKRRYKKDHFALKATCQISLSAALFHLLFSPSALLDMPDDHWKTHPTLLHTRAPSLPLSTVTPTREHCHYCVVVVCHAARCQGGRQHWLMRRCGLRVQKQARRQEGPWRREPRQWIRWPAILPVSDNTAC